MKNAWMYQRYSSDSLPKDLLINLRAVNSTRVTPTWEMKALLKSSGIKLGDVFPPKYYEASSKHAWLWSEWASDSNEYADMYIFCRDEMTKFKVLMIL